MTFCMPSGNYKYFHDFPSVGLSDDNKINTKSSLLWSTFPAQDLGCVSMQQKMETCPVTMYL